MRSPHLRSPLERPRLASVDLLLLSNNAQISE